MSDELPDNLRPLQPGPGACMSRLFPVDPGGSTAVESGRNQQGDGGESEWDSTFSACDS
jgi:hypothetical protein